MLYLLALTDRTSFHNGVPFNTIFPESISPEVIFLRPPEKLIIEIHVVGRYSRFVWHRNGTDVQQSLLFNFNEIYVVEETTTADFGHYQFIPFSSPPTVQLVRPPQLNFIVTSPGMCVKYHNAVWSLPSPIATYAIWFITQQNCSKT